MLRFGTWFIVFIFRAKCDARNYLGATVGCLRRLQYVLSGMIEKRANFFGVSWKNKNILMIIFIMQWWVWWVRFYACREALHNLQIKDNFDFFFFLYPYPFFDLFKGLFRLKFYTDEIHAIEQKLQDLLNGIMKSKTQDLLVMCDTKSELDMNTIVPNFMARYFWEKHFGHQVGFKSTLTNSTHIFSFNTRFLRWMPMIS